MDQEIIRFSVIMPLYNKGAYVEKAIRSVLEQTYPHYELIVVNDGSKDNTQQIAEGYVARFPRIFRLINKENGGHGSAVNAGLAVATGQFFKVVDSDDWVNEKALQAVLDTLEVYQDDIELLISNYVYEKQGAKHKKEVDG